MGSERDVPVDTYPLERIQKMATQRFVSGMSVNNKVDAEVRGLSRGPDEPCAASALFYVQSLTERSNNLFPFYTAKDPLGIFLDWAGERKNLWGSTVRVSKHRCYFMLETLNCAVMKTATEMGRKREEFCDLCMLWHRDAMRHLGMEIEIDLTRDGCEYKLCRFEKTESEEE